jgi:hypothetical protein
MDALINAVWWILRPLVVALWWAEAALGCIFALPNILITLSKQGLKKGTSILSMWQAFSVVPFGKAGFSSLAGVFAPYAATISVFVKDISVGRCVASITQRCVAPQSRYYVY